MANTTQAAHAAFEKAKQLFGHAVQGLKNVKWEELPDHVKEHIKNNRKMTAFQVATFLVSIIPGLVAGPVLGIMGFSKLGPVAGMSRDRWIVNTIPSHR